MALRQVSKTCPRYLSPTRVYGSPTRRRPPLATSTVTITRPKLSHNSTSYYSTTRLCRAASNTSSQDDNALVHSKDDSEHVTKMSQKKLELLEMSNVLKNWAFSQQTKIDIASFAKFVAALNIELPQSYKRLLPSSMRMTAIKDKENANEIKPSESKEDIAKERLAREANRERHYRTGDEQREQHDFLDAMTYTNEATKEIQMYSSAVDLSSDKAKLTTVEKIAEEQSNLVKSTVANSLPSIPDKLPKKPDAAGPVAGLWEMLPSFPRFLSRNKEVDSPTKVEEQKKKLEKKKKELIKRPVISKSMIDKRTRALVINVKQATSPVSQLLRLEEFCKHLSQYPDAKTLATKEKVMPTLLRFEAGEDEALAAQAREALALVGHVKPVKGPGIRILSIDGGGTRGLMVIDMLRKLEELAQKDIRQMFDLICGVSTGALIAALISVYKVPLDECERIYKEFSKEMFSRHRLLGTSKLFMSHAYYDSKLWEDILKRNLGEKTFLEATRDPDCCKVSAVSAIVNQATMQNFIFSNYSFPPGVYSHYPGSMHHHIWEGIRASSAAPGYFEEYRLDDSIHQDGGLLTNNPTAIAIHEAKLLWPDEKIHCVVSMGTGRHKSTDGPVPTYTLKDKLNKIVQSATDTEAVHTMLSDLLHPNSYYRVNPYLSENFDLDEIRPDKWDQMHQDASMYMRKNEQKFEAISKHLVQPRKKHQLTMDWLQNQAKQLL